MKGALKDEAINIQCSILFKFPSTIKILSPCFKCPGGARGAVSPDMHHSCVQSQTPSKVPLPNLPTGGCFLVPLRLRSHPKSLAACFRWWAPDESLGKWWRQDSLLPHSTAPSKPSESITSSKSPARLHPDILWEKLNPITESTLS